MSFPKLKHCLVCDNAREETRGKVTLLGFLGVSPDVEILLPAPNVVGVIRPVQALQLSFVFVGGPGDGTHHVTYELYDVQKKTALGTIDTGQPITIPPPSVTGRRTNFIVNVLMPVPHFGAYELRLLVGGKLNFTGYFQISKHP